MKTEPSHDWRSFYLSQYDWLKGSHTTEVVWLLNETDYSYCEIVAPNTPYDMEMDFRRTFCQEYLVCQDRWSLVASGLSRQVSLYYGLRFSTRNLRKAIINSISYRQSTGLARCTIHVNVGAIYLYRCFV